MSAVCGCGCDRPIASSYQACAPVLPWDTPGLPPRPATDRCGKHPHCAYRDDDPARCGACHGTANCTCNPSWSPPTTKNKTTRRKK